MHQSVLLLEVQRNVQLWAQWQLLETNINRAMGLASYEKVNVIMVGLWTVLLESLLTRTLQVLCCILLSHTSDLSQFSRGKLHS